MDALTNTHIVIISGSSIGLENDAKVMQAALKKHYPSVQLSILLGKDPLLKKSHALAKLCLTRLSNKNVVFIHMEELQSRLTWLAKQNYLIPNQEWFRSVTEKKVRQNQQVQLLCKTKEAMRAFSDYAARRHYLGFSSINRYQGSVTKDFGRFLHLAGKSEKKGTASIIRAWQQHPHWPTLTLKTSVEEYIAQAQGTPNIRLIREALSQTALLELMNSHGVHLCVSEMEGFGHYIVEALSTGAIVVTTNAAPMNELVSKECGFLVDCKQSYQQYRGRGFHIDAADFARCIDTILALDQPTLATMSHHACVQYAEIADNFDRSVKDFFAQKLVS